MRKLTANEIRLVKLLGAVLILIAAAFGIVSYKRAVASLKTELAALEVRKSEADFWMDEKPLWDERRSWMLQSMPVLPPDGSAASSFLGEIQQTAQSSGLTITSQSLLEPISEQDFEKIGLRIRVTGTLEQLVRWLVLIQQPEKFQEVSTFNLKSDKEPPAVVCELQVSRFYRKSKE